MFKKLLLVCALSAFIVPASFAQNAEEAAVAAAAEKLRVLMVDPQKAALDALVADQLSYGHSGGKIDTKASFVDDLMTAKSDFVSIDISGQSIQVVQDAAVLRHTLAANTLDGGKPGTVNLKILQVWQKQGGAWKLLARQAVRVQ